VKKNGQTKERKTCEKKRKQAEGYKEGQFPLGKKKKKGP